jgi:hypothetical protein
VKPMISVASRAKRVFRVMGRFKFINDPAEIPHDLPLGGGEGPIGIYFNTPSSLADAIVVTSVGLILRTESGWLSIPYRIIAKVTIPARIGHLAEVRELTLTLLGGESLALPILGGTARTADAFEFSRFLDRVLSDLEKRG